ncbi:MAG: hypothetical protein ACTSXX_12335 [Candidatus Baldrarchaeia archaeon]
MKGDYIEVLRTCRNVIMNYLAKRESREKLAKEIENYILSKIPETQRSLYEVVLDSLGKTLYNSPAPPQFH